jgi:N6-adenosine-specific RNA methylase IME4
VRKQCPVCQQSFTPLRADAVTCSARCRVARARWIQTNTPAWPQGVYDLVVVDLPLRWTGYSAKGEERSPQHHYRTMDTPALIRQLTPMFTRIMAKDSAACFWVYGPRLPDTLWIAMESGFTYKSELFIWIKTTKAGTPRLGTGKTTRKVGETAWLMTRGKGLPIRDHGVSQAILTEEGVMPLTIESPRRGHSQKPDGSYHALERLYGEVRRLDMYGRCSRPGWAVWGNDIAEIEAAQ